MKIPLSKIMRLTYAAIWHKHCLPLHLETKTEKMKLAEALSIRAELQRKVSQLKNRIKDSAKIQEGDVPAESVEELFAELGDCLSQLEELVFRINRTNMQTMHGDETLTHMIARKDALSMRISVMREVISHVMETDRFGRNEIRYIRTVDIAELRKKTDAYSKQLRELDLQLQSLNWAIDLI